MRGEAAMNALLICLVCICMILIMLRIRARAKAYSGISLGAHHEPRTIENLTEYIKQSLHELSHSQLADAGLHEEEYKRKLNQRAEMRRALKDCISGSVSDKSFVKNIIKDLLLHSYGLNEKSINEAIPFDHTLNLTVQDQFEIVFYLYKQQYGTEALST